MLAGILAVLAYVALVAIVVVRDEVTNPITGSRSRFLNAPPMGRTEPLPPAARAA